MTLHNKIIYSFVSFTLISSSILSICAHTTYAKDKDDNKNNRKTYNTVKGTIKESDGKNAVGATVIVTCKHNGTMTTHTAVSASNGMYSVIFDSLLCRKGDLLTVTAAGGQDQGSEEGTMGEKRAVVNVKLVDAVTNVPEFGTVAIMILSGMIGLGAFIGVRDGYV